MIRLEALRQYFEILPGSKGARCLQCHTCTGRHPNSLRNHFSKWHPDIDMGGR